MIISIKKLKKCALFVLIAIIIAATGLIVISGHQSKKNIPAPNCPDNYSRTAYLNLLGWKVSEEPVQENEITIPYKFNDKFKQYNEIQKLQNFDLSKYKGCKATQYIYDVTNYPNNLKNIRAVLIIYNGNIIGGDIHSTEVNGFMTGLDEETLY